MSDDLVKRLERLEQRVIRIADALVRKSNEPDRNLGHMLFALEMGEIIADLKGEQP